MNYWLKKIENRRRTNRQNRYRKYQSVRSRTNIEWAMTTWSDIICKKNKNGNIFEIKCENDEIKEETEHLFRNILKFDAPENLYSEVKQLLLIGDRFWELVVDPKNPEYGVIGINKLPPDNMYRIETIQSKLIEFQQSKDGPDYSLITRRPMLTYGSNQTPEELSSSGVIRFAQTRLIHLKINGNIKEFYPYGVSLLEHDDPKTRTFEKLRTYIENAIWEIAIRHLKLRGHIKDGVCENLVINMNSPLESENIFSPEIWSPGEEVRNYLNN